jgi:serine/threonine protein kinase
LAELATGEVVERRGAWRLPRAPEECPEAVLSLIQECVQLDPKQRPTAAQALQQLRAAV